MKKATYRLTVPLLIVLVCCIWIYRIQHVGLENQADNPSSAHSSIATTEAGPSSKFSAIPEIFSKKGIPTPTIPVLRGANKERQYGKPVQKSLPEVIEHSSPAIMAKTPADGRIELLPEEIDLHTLKSRRMVLDTAALDRVVNGETNHIIAPTPGTEILDLKISSIKTRSKQTHTFLGKIAGEEEFSDVLIVYHDGIIHGSVARYDKDQHFEYRILPDGHMMVRELDTSTMTAVCGNPDLEKDHECKDGCGHEKQEEPAPEGADPEAANEGTVVEDTTNWTTVDVVVGYDAGARVADGGTSQIEARIITSIDRMSTAFVNSLVTDSEVMLLGTIEDPDYVFPGATAGTMSSGDELGDLESNTDGILDTVSDYATLLGADLRSFVVKEADGSAGIAYKPGRSSVTARDYMTSTRITFAHELGHNLGCDHSWGDSNQSYHARYGWRFKTTGGVEYRTIMAYDWGWGVRIPYYANPDVSYGGTPTGANDKANVSGNTFVDQRYVTGGLGYTGSDPNKSGFDGTNAALGARNAQMLLVSSGSNGVAYAAGRATRTGLSVTSPIASDEWNAGDTHTISFTGGDMDHTATIDLYKNGSYDSTIATGVNCVDRNYSWTLPGGLQGGTNYSIRVTISDEDTSSQFATSATFTISNDTQIILTNPTGGESWNPGQTESITWISGLGGNVKIELLKNNSLNTVISSSTANDGEFAWSIPSNQTLGSDYKIKVTSLSNTSKTDTSTSNFSISSQPTLATALDTIGLSWSTTSGKEWYPQTTTTHDTVDAAQSASITHSESSSLETTLSGPGQLTFWWKVSSESSYDYLRFYINGVEQTGSISGNVNWTQKTFTIPSGNTTVKWSYTKDHSVSSGSDAGWVDEVVFTPDATTYNVTYDRNGTQDVSGSVPTDTNQYEEGDTVTVLGNTGSLTKSGYTFAGWNTAINGLGTDYSASDTFTMGASNVTLYAKWTQAGSLAVTPNESLTASGLHGGPFSPTSKTYTLENTGLTSLSWTASKSANWVNLSKTSGTLAAGATTTVIVSINSNANTLSIGSHSNTVTFTNTTNGVGNTTRSANLTVNPNTYAVTYSGNENSTGEAPSSQTKTQGIALTLASNTGDLGKDGYAFDGWNTEPDGSGTDYAEGATYTGNEPLTLYAKWNTPPTVDAGSSQTVYMSGAAAWTPAEISTIAWYDANDASTITHSSGAVSQWNDKSGNNHHMKQSTASAKPVYSTSDSMLGGRPSISTGSSYKYLTMDSSISIKRMYLVTYYGNGTETTWSNHNALIGTTDGSIRLCGRANGNSVFDGGRDGKNFDIGGTTYRNGSTTSTTEQANGLPITGEIFSITAASAKTARWRLLGNNANYTLWNGGVGEVIFTDGTESADEQKMIEGYLAHKWGMENKLPTTHPYKDNPPGGPAATVTLSGSVSDVDGDSITQQWTKASGPSAGVSFDDDTALDATATFTEAGTYTLRLTANDGLQENDDTVQITVETPPLTVSIADASISENGGTTTATISRIGTSGDLVVSLSSSDTGEATIPSNATILDGSSSVNVTITGVTDSIVDGNQTVTITASADANVDGTDTVLVTDVDAASYTNWSSSESFSEPLTNTTTTVDFDGGGISTGLEYVLGGDPTSGTDDASIEPVMDRSDATYFIYTYRRSDVANADPNTTITVQYGGNLNSWTTAIHDGTDIIITADDDAAGEGIDLVEVKIHRDLINGNRIFARLNVDFAN